MAQVYPKLQPGTTIQATTLKSRTTATFRIGELANEGGSAYVYSGNDESARQLVVKVAKAARDNLAFRLEEQIFQHLNSPQFSKLIAGGELPSGARVLVFERLYENPLIQLNKKGIKSKVKTLYDGRAYYCPLPGITALELAREHLTAVDSLHRQGYVHCDIKLPNLMIRLDPKGVDLSDKEYFDRVKRGSYRGVLIDAGGVRSAAYLKSLNAGNEDKTLIAPQCTPVFAPPEVVLEPHYYSPGMDVYATALLIYSLITGHVPYSHTQRKLNPTDLMALWEFKAAENRGEISPINFEVIQSVYYPDSHLNGGPKQRPRFDHDLYKLLNRHVNPDVTKRGDIHQFLADFDALFEFESNRIHSQLLRVSSSQNVFQRSSSLKRLVEAGSEKFVNATTKADNATPEPSAADSGRFSLRVDPRKIGRTLQPRDQDLSESTKTRRRSLRTETQQLSGAEIRSRLIDRPMGGGRPKTSSGITPPPTPTAKSPARSSGPHKRHQTGRLGQRRASSHADTRPPARRGTQPREGVSKRRPTNRLPRKPILPPTQSGGHRAVILEGPERIGETLDSFIKIAKLGREEYLKRHPEPVLFLEHYGSCLVSEDAPTTAFRRSHDPKSDPVLFPVKALPGRSGRSISIGRANARDIQVCFASVSKLHAALAVDQNSGNWVISDLGSTNGTQVGATPLEALMPHLLTDLARVQIGGETLVFFKAESFYKYLENFIRME